MARVNYKGKLNGLEPLDAFHFVRRFHKECTHSVVMFKLLPIVVNRVLAGCMLCLTDECSSGRFRFVLSTSGFRLHCQRFRFSSDISFVRCRVHGRSSIDREV